MQLVLHAARSRCTKPWSGGTMVKPTCGWHRGFVVGVLLAGLSASTGAPGTAVPPAAAAEPIGHAIVIIQENQSFDNLFGDPLAPAAAARECPRSMPPPALATDSACDHLRYVKCRWLGGTER